MSRFKGMYWRQFGISVGLVALTLALLGASFFSLTYSYMMTERRVELEEKAEIIAQMAERAYSGSSAGLGLWSEELRDLVDVAQQMSDINFLIWVPRYGSFVSTDASVANQQLTLPEAMGERLARGETYAGNSTLGIYSHPRFVVAIPARSTDSGEVLVGPVLAVMESAPMTEMWRAFLGIFLLTAITVLIIAFMATAAIVGQQTKPIKDMAIAARNFAEGNFDARVRDTGRDDEIGELTEAFNAMADSLQKTEQQRREFIANISHELKTPMTTIAGYADGILDGVISPEEERQYLSIISAESRRLSRLVRRMLDVSQLQSMDLIKQKKPFDLSESMRRVLVSMEKKITDRGLDVDVEIPEDPVIVLGDNDLLTQVVYNLLENAVKFVNEGGYIEVSYTVEQKRTYIHIKNSGEGIPKEEISKVFDRFYKTDRSRSMDKTGVGLGLYIVRQIVNLHQGEVIVRSVEGEYCEFSFSVATAPKALTKQPKPVDVREV